jgi:hypothetical protein
MHYDFKWILLATHLHNLPHNYPIFFDHENERTCFSENSGIHLFTCTWSQLKIM